MSLEKHWALALKKTRQKNTRQSVTLTDRKEQLKEELAHFKAELKKQIDADNPQIDRILRAMFELRAEQVLLKMQEFKNKYGFAAENIARKETQLYFHDCTRLLKAARQKLS